MSFHDYEDQMMMNVCVVLPTHISRTACPESVIAEVAARATDMMTTGTTTATDPTHVSTTARSSPLHAVDNQEKSRFMTTGASTLKHNDRWRNVSRSTTYKTRMMMMMMQLEPPSSQFVWNVLQPILFPPTASSSSSSSLRPLFDVGQDQIDRPSNLAEPSTQRPALGQALPTRRQRPRRSSSRRCAILQAQRCLRALLPYACLVASDVVVPTIPPPHVPEQQKEPPTEAFSNNHDPPDVQWAWYSWPSRESGSPLVVVMVYLWIQPPTIRNQGPLDHSAWTGRLLTWEHGLIRAQSVLGFFSTLGGGYFYCRDYAAARQLAWRQALVARHMGQAALVYNSLIHVLWNTMHMGPRAARRTRTWIRTLRGILQQQHDEAASSPYHSSFGDLAPSQREQLMVMLDSAYRWCQGLLRHYQQPQHSSSSSSSLEPTAPDQDLLLPAEATTLSTTWNHDDDMVRLEMTPRQTPWTGPKITDELNLEALPMLQT